MTVAELNAGMIDHGNADNLEETASEADTDRPHSMGALLSVLERTNSISNNDRNVLDATAAC
jgi:hypothetical protein